MGTEMESMNSNVPTMVTTPVNSWLNPCSRPSPIWSTSLTTREIKSPCGCASMKLMGMRPIFSLASTRISRTQRYVSRLTQMPLHPLQGRGSKHHQGKLDQQRRQGGKVTRPMPMMRSMACPTTMGT